MEPEVSEGRSRPRRGLSGPAQRALWAALGGLSVCFWITLVMILISNFAPI